MPLQRAILNIFNKVEVSHDKGKDPLPRVVKDELELVLANGPGLRVQVHVDHLPGVLAVVFWKKLGYNNPKESSRGDRIESLYARRE